MSFAFFPVFSIIALKSFFSKFIIFSPRGCFIISFMYNAIFLGASGNKFFVSSFLIFGGNASKGTPMWKPLLPENLHDIDFILWNFSALTTKSAASLEYSKMQQ